jgi:hypothetical protein
MAPKKSKKNPAEGRPSIWAEGSQNPPFELRAFALATVIYTRESLSGLLDRCSASAAGAAVAMAEGRWRVPSDRLGRSGRYLPRVETVAQAIHGGGEVLSRAARRVTPGAEMVAAQSIFTARPDPARMTAPKPPETEAGTVAEPEGAALWSAPSASQAGDPADSDLAAIRALIEAPPAAPRPLRPAARVTTADTAPAPRPAATGWRREWLADTLATGLGYGLLVVSVPIGAVRAALAHLNGEDLRKLVAEG